MSVKSPSKYKNNTKNYRKKHSYPIILSGLRILIDWTNANMNTLKIVLFSLSFRMPQNPTIFEFIFVSNKLELYPHAWQQKSRIGYIRTQA